MLPIETYLHSDFWLNQCNNPGGYTDTNLVQRGSFKTVTPMKSFNVKSIRNKTGKGSYVIQVDCYTDSAKNHYVGTFQSAAFNIK